MSAYKRYAHITLEAQSEALAVEEAIRKWGEVGAAVQSNVDIGSRRRNFSFFKDEFIADQEIRAKDGVISLKRVIVLKHQLASLERFWAENNKPVIDELSRRYERDFPKWRSSKTRLVGGRDTGKPLTPRTRNTEAVTHKMFFRWCSERGYGTRVPEVSLLKLQRANLPFPKDAYLRLLKVSREEIQNLDSSRDGTRKRNDRIKWELMNIRTVILLMSGVGCRVLETKNLKWSDLKETKNGTFCYFHGKNKERTIRLPERVYGHLKDLRKFKEATQKGYNSDDFPYVFNGWNSPTPSNQYSGDVRKRWCEKAGLDNPADWEFVCFRHKFITEALNNGAHSLTVAKYTGTSQAMIEKTYEGLVAGEVYDLVFKNVPSDALDGKTSPKWLEDLTSAKNEAL
jgi:integrase